MKETGKCEKRREPELCRSQPGRHLERSCRKGLEDIHVCMIFGQLLLTFFFFLEIEVLNKPEEGGRVGKEGGKN